MRSDKTEHLALARNTDALRQHTESIDPHALACRKDGFDVVPRPMGGPFAELGCRNRCDIYRKERVRALLAVEINLITQLLLRCSERRFAPHCPTLQARSDCWDSPCRVHGLLKQPPAAIRGLIN